MEAATKSPLVEASSPAATWRAWVATTTALAVAWSAWVATRSERAAVARGEAYRGQRRARGQRGAHGHERRSRWHRGAHGRRNGGNASVVFVFVVVQQIIDQLIAGFEARQRRGRAASPWPGTRRDHRSCAAGLTRAKPDRADRQSPLLASTKRSHPPGHRVSTAPSRSAVPTPRHRRRHRAAPEMAGEARSWGEGEGHGALGSCYENQIVRAYTCSIEGGKGPRTITNADV